MAELRWGAATDTGRVRTANEDSVLAVAEVFAVADGMGGHAAGEVASSLAVDALGAALAGKTVTEQVVIEAIQAANEAVFRRSLSEASARGMGTTLTLIAPTVGDDGRDQLVVANVGDSRGYVFADGELRQLTRDHSYVEEMLAAGQISSEEARSHPHRHVVTRALGVEPSVAVDTWLVTPEPGDRYLLCSDGLVNDVVDERIAFLLASTPEPQAAADALVAAANEAGGRDNITVVVIDVATATGQEDPAVATAIDTSLTTAAGGVTAVGGWLPDDLASAFDEPPPESTTLPATTTTTPSTPPKPKRRLVTVRTIVFVTLVAAVFVAAFAVIAAAGRSGYYVGFRGDTVAVYQGRPGGVLWFKPTLESRSELRRADLTPDYQARIARNPTFSSLAKANHYLETLATTDEALAAATTTTVTTTTVTTTSSPALTTTRPPSSTSTTTSAGP
jgi:PPM family protein phosphatase